MITRDFIIAAVAPELQRLRRRLAGVVIRGFVTLVKDEFKTQKIQAGALADEVQDDVERFQNYGFSSVPDEDAEALLLSVGALRSHTICIIVNDPRYRPTGMKKGDTAMYDKRGQIISMTDEGTAIKTTKKLIADAPDIRLGSDAAAKKIVHEQIAALIKTEILKCTDSLGGPLNAAAAFLPGWASAALSTKAKTE